MSRGRRTFAIGLTAVVVVALMVTPALAHGEDEEADPVNLVEQALAIVVSTPTAADEALERIEAALAAEAEEPTGELNIASLELAAASLESGDLHEAEDALVAALGSDPHAGATDPGEAATEPLIQPDEESAGDSQPAPAVTTADAASQEAAVDAHDEEVADPELEATGLAAHGLTERVDGGWQAPSGLDIAALAVAGVLAAGGFAMAMDRKRRNA